MLYNQADLHTYRSGPDLPDRSQVPEEHQWQLSDIYPSEADWNQDYTRVNDILNTMKEYQGKATESAATLLACLSARDELGIIMGKLYAYARMHRDENSANPKYQAMTGKAQTLGAMAGAAASFIEPEIIACSEEKLSCWLSETPKLQPYHFYFENLSRQKKHVLSPAEERILSLSADIAQASESIFNMLAHADMEFPLITGEDGKEIRLSEGRYQLFIKSPDRKVREQAFIELFSTYNKFRNTFAASLGGNVKKDGFYTQVRNYSSTLAANLESDNVPMAVYDNMINTIHQHLPLLHRYVALKQKALKLDEIHMYDLYAPLVSDVKLNINYTEAKQLILEGLAPLGAPYQAVLEQGFNSKWIDVYENKGKQTGAYSFGTYSVHPFVLMNFNDRYESVSTLAHEMGHAIHSYYSQANQPFITSHYTIFSAEVASTTNEILLLDHMLRKIDEKRTKMYLINQYLENIRATVFRQTMFAEFEKIIHQQVQEGEPLTADSLNQLWRDLNIRYYGPDIVIDKEIEVEWARIPHFYSSFYVYQYVTGYSAATALAKQIQEQGSPAQNRYLTFLKSGGSDYSISLLKQAGVDMAQPEAIAVTLSVFEERLNQLEDLLNCK